MKEERPAGHVNVFCQNLVYTLEFFFNFKNNVLLTNGSILEINDYYRTRGNVNFTELSEIKITLSNQNFAGLDNFNKLDNLFCSQGVARKLN